MATLRDIKRRIGSVSSTRQITSAMKMVSAAKLARAHAHARAGRPYAEAFHRIVESAAQYAQHIEHPLFQENKHPSVAVCLFTSDRGLAGAFNTQVCRKALAFLTELRSTHPQAEPALHTIGRKGEEFFRRRGWHIESRASQLSNAERNTHVRKLARSLSTAFAQGKLGSLHLTFNAFHNPMRQEALTSRLLPMTLPPPPAQAEGPQQLLLLEPDPYDLLDGLLHSFVENQLLFALKDTEAGEHGARMVSMDGATRNAGEMIDKLSLQYNRLRQAVITRELIEIINGAEVL